MQLFSSWSVTFQYQLTHAFVWRASDFLLTATTIYQPVLEMNEPFCLGIWFGAHRLLHWSLAVSLIWLQHDPIEILRSL